MIIDQIGHERFVNCRVWFLPRAPQSPTVDLSSPDHYLRSYLFQIDIVEIFIVRFDLRPVYIIIAETILCWEREDPPKQSPTVVMTHLDSFSSLLVKQFNLVTSLIRQHHNWQSHHCTAVLLRCPNMTHWHIFLPCKTVENFSKFCPFSKCWPIFKMFTYFPNVGSFSKFGPIFKMLTHSQNFHLFSKCWPIFKMFTQFQNFINSLLSQPDIVHCTTLLHQYWA